MSTMQVNSRSKTMTRSLAVLSTLVLATAIPAQDLIHKAAPQTRPVLIRNATIHTITGNTIQAGSIWFENGVRIRGV